VNMNDAVKEVILRKYRCNNPTCPVATIAWPMVGYVWDDKKDCPCFTCPECGQPVTQEGPCEEKNRLTIADYSRLAGKTAVYTGRNTIKGLLYCALGLAGEAGEVANQAKKIIRDDDVALYQKHESLPEERKAKLIDELGDVLWYVVMSIRELGGCPDAVARQNLSKLSARAAHGEIKGDRREKDYGRDSNA